MADNFVKIYTPRASLCALGIYLNQHHLFDDLNTLPVPQKKDCSFAVGKNDWYDRPDFSRGNGDEPNGDIDSPG